jgi:hypothetical protein
MNYFQVTSKGHTQNSNESFKSKVWSVFPKTTTCGHNIVKMATVSVGVVTKLKILENFDV